jgi:hypothetical protein
MQGHGTYLPQPAARPSALRCPDRAASHRRPPAGQALAAEVGYIPDVGYIPEIDGPTLERLCADDARMKGFWGLAEHLLDSEVDWIIERLLLAVTAATAVPEAAWGYKAALADAEEAIAKLGELCAIPGVLEGRPKLSSVLGVDVGEQPLNNEPLGEGTPGLIDCLLWAKIHLEKRREALAVEASDAAVSRKAENAPHVIFMVEAADALDECFEQPTLDIVADLVSVIYDVEISAEAVRKARKRDAQEKAKRSKEVDPVAEQLKEIDEAGQFEP